MSHSDEHRGTTNGKNGLIPLEGLLGNEGMQPEQTTAPRKVISL